MGSPLVEEIGSQVLPEQRRLDNEFSLSEGDWIMSFLIVYGENEQVRNYLKKEITL